MDVLIHVADGMINGDLDYATRIEERLAAAGLESARCDLTALPGERPPAARAHVFTGGETSVHSDARWMRSAIDMARCLVANAERENYSVIGICLGSQILAEALRPDSIVSSPTMEVGLTVARAGDERIQQVVPAFHYQAISPEVGSTAGVSIEWSNEHTAVQAFRYRDRTFGCQFHPELSATDVHKLIDYHEDVITRWRGDVTAARQSVDHHADALSADLFRRMVIDRIVG